MYLSELNAKITNIYYITYYNILYILQFYNIQIIIITKHKYLIIRLI